MSLAALGLAAVAIAVALSAMLAGAWALQQRTGTSSWIDCGWTLAVGITGVAGALAPLSEDASPWRQLTAAGLVAVWCARLGFHLLRRALRGGDDPRYADLNRQWGKDAPRQMFWFAQAQAVAALPLGLAATLAAHRPGPAFDAQDAAAIGIMLIGISGAALSDFQLRQFARDGANRNAVCDAGLWRWSRHPNYFFEWLGWLGLSVFAVDFSGNYLLGWLALAAPALMYWLLVHVSGIPLLEQHMLRTRGAAFADYQSRTSAFFPWPPARTHQTRTASPEQT